jgi:DNA repair protein RadC
VMSKWQHAGGKLREQGAGSLTDSEVLAILISSGIPGKSAQQIADDVVEKFQGVRNLANQPLEALLEIKGLSDVKIIRIAAAYELARRLVDHRLPQ